MAQTQVVRGTATKVTRDDDAIRVFYHDTMVCKAEQVGNVVRITLNTGGYRTRTTKLRMNQFAAEYCSQQYGVYQKNGQWFVAINDRVTPISFVGNTCAFIIDADKVRF